MAIFSYAGDNADYFPVLYVNGSPDPNQAPPLTNPYLGIKETAYEMYFNPSYENADRSASKPYNGSKVFYCPARKNISQAKARNSDYGAYINWWVPKYYELKISHLKKPTQSLLRVDSQYDATAEYGALFFNKWERVHFRHLGRANTLFFDGHVSSVSFSISASMTFPNFAQLE